jgi:two-component system, LytTR family, response regulator
MTAILIDDEPNATEALQNMLQMTNPDVQVVGTANDPLKGLAMLQQQPPDILFLDIQMPHMTGFELLENLGKINFSVVFTTAYDQYALQAFKVSAVDYLLKPIDMDELEAAVGKARERKQSVQPDFGAFEKLFQYVQKSDGQRLSLPLGDGLMFVNISDIVRLQSDSNYTTFHLANREKVLVSRTMGEYEPILEKQNFCRVHHSHIINLAHLRRYIKTDGGYAEMSDGSKVEISRRKKDDFVAMLGGGAFF